MLGGFLLLAGIGIVLPPLKCVVADEFPQIEAVITPPASTARFYFKGAGDPEYYFVDMLPKVGRFVAQLPKPKQTAGPLSYYIAVVGPDGAKARTPELQADVVRTAESCPNPRAVAEIGPSRDVEVKTETASARMSDAFTGMARVRRAGP